MDKMDKNLDNVWFDAEQKAPRLPNLSNVPITRKHAGLHKTRQEPLPALGQKWILAPSLLGQLDVIVSKSIAKGKLQ